MEDAARKGSGVDLWFAVWSRRKWLAIIGFALPFSAVIPLVAFLPNIYQSTATVIVERQQVPEAFVRSTVTSEVDSRLQTISEEVLSRSRLESLINRFGLYPELRKRVSLEELIIRMRGDIKLEKKVGARGHGAVVVAFAISYRGSDPETAALVTNALASFYVEENLKVRERQATGTAEFLKVQVEETKKRLDEQERRLSEFKKRHLGELPEQMQANLATLERLNVQLRINSDTQNRAGERRDALAKQLAEADPAAPTEGPDATAARIAGLRQELAALRTRFSDRYPEVIRARAEIAALERQLTETKSDGRLEPQPAAVVSPQVLRLKQTLNEVESEIKVLRAEEKHLRSAIATHHQRVENTPRREQESQEMSRGYETIKSLYNSLLARLEEALVAESMEQRQKGEQFRVLDPALPSGLPVAPKRSQVLLLGLVLSLGLAAGAVVLAEKLDTSFHTLDDLRGFTNVPVLVSIPRIVTAADASRGRRWMQLASLGAIVGLVLIAGTSYVVARGNEQLVRMLGLGS